MIRKALEEFEEPVERPNYLEADALAARTRQLGDTPFMPWLLSGYAWKRS